MVPTLPMDTGRQRDAVHYLRSLQESAAHLSGQCPARRDSATGSKGGWTAPQVYPSRWPHGLSKKKRKRDVLVPSMDYIEKKEMFFLKE